MQKNAKKHIKSKEKRPKAIDSSHNACRYGYPFFLSPSDDDAMLEIPNPTPSVHQTPGYYCWFFFLCRPKKKRNTTQQNSPEKKTQRQVKNEHCTFIPNPQNSKNIKITTQNYQITAKSMKI